MNNSSFCDFDQCILSNYLLPEFINKIGISKVKLAVRQALDLQRMQGTRYTLPILIVETCGTALVDSEFIKNHIGLTFIDHGMLLIYSGKLKCIQLLRDNYDL